MKSLPSARDYQSRGQTKITPRVILAVFFLSCGVATGAAPQTASSVPLTPHLIQLPHKPAFSLNLPEQFRISVAAAGLRRVRFIAQAPDGRLFATDMYSLADNHRGKIYILNGFDEKAGKFAKLSVYLDNLHNPNSIAFYTDPAGQDWLYVALTEKLVRFKFVRGETSPSSQPQTLAAYPQYGLSYKYGGWHLTRTIAFGRDAGKDRLYVTVGSSCNACIEKEEIRATLSVMDPDGQNVHIVARGLRNAVGLSFVGSVLYATNMGADHLGDDAPDDTMFAFTAQQLATPSPLNYGWPYCYFQEGHIHDDLGFPPPSQNLACSGVPSPFATFRAHGSPLGLQYFGPDASDPTLQNHFLVALHGSGRQQLARGFRLVSVDDHGKVSDFMTGFLLDGKVHGRPCGIFKLTASSFLLTDDNAGAIYYVRPK